MREIKLTELGKIKFNSCLINNSITGQLELTYRNLNCIHCYLQGNDSLKAQRKELSFDKWKKILDKIHKAGCVWLTLAGGEPLIREDFFDIYSYARNKGFLVNIFTNRLLFNEKKIKYLKKFPPHSTEITLNGITKNAYESITQKPGSFEMAIEVINELIDEKSPLVLKANGLKQNKDDFTAPEGINH